MQLTKLLHPRLLPLLLIHAAVASAAPFDPETVLWTDTPIESVLAEQGKYRSATQINPNASNRERTKVQSPYGNQGRDFLTEWAYSEYLWTRFYPVGCGRLAAMVAGGIDDEVIQINEDTCWDGSPYGSLCDEKGRPVATLADAARAKRITTREFTSGSVKDSWRYYRGADAAGAPAPIGAADVVVGSEEFRAAHPEWASRSISRQALEVDNSPTDEAVAARHALAGMVEGYFLGNPRGQRAYKSFVELYLDFGHDYTKASDYTKSLDLTDGTVTVAYSHGGASYRRTTFASYPDQAVVTLVESDRPMDFTATLHSYHAKDPRYYKYVKISDREVALRARVTDGNMDSVIGRINAVGFEARMMLRGKGRFKVSEDGRTVNVSGTRRAEIYVVGATNYIDYQNLDNTKPRCDCDRYTANLRSRDYEQIRRRHVEDFSPLFSRTSLHLANADAAAGFSALPTDRRVRHTGDFRIGAGSKLNANPSVGTTYSLGDNQLAALEFNYGKYLIISGSRPGRAAGARGELEIASSQPLNLTGKWNAAMSAGWNGKYTININTQMNYWAAQPLALAECEEPLLDTFADLAASGSVTADWQYGIGDSRSYAPGAPWVMHHNFDLWRGTQPIDNATAGLWPTGGAWLLDHAWQHYLYTGDRERLASAYPLMAGAARFFTDFLVTDPRTGYLVTAASCSPEQGGVQPGPAMDTQLIRNLYHMVLNAARVLGREEADADLIGRIRSQLPAGGLLADEAGRLAPNLIDQEGRIREWVRGDVTFDFSRSNDPLQHKYKNVVNPFNGTTVSINEHTATNHNGHRHCSHLWEMYPGTHLSAYSEDKDSRRLFDAYRTSVAARGAGSGQGWGVAWRISLNARALEGDQASSMLEQLLQTRTSPNLFDQHPNFQIDGNYGATAGVIEMLIQSHDDAISLLPALPERWSDGSFDGFNTRQGATVSLVWEDGIPTEATVTARQTRPLSLRAPGIAAATVKAADGTEVRSTLSADGSRLTFPAEAGTTYTLTGFRRGPVHIGNESFPSIGAAVARAIVAAPSSEAERIVIDIDPGDYEEQVYIDSVSYLTLRQTPGTQGRVNLHWMWCTGYCAGNCDLDGRHDPLLNWSDPRTWQGYADLDENGTVLSDIEEDFTPYRIGQELKDVKTISYYTSDGKAHRDVPVTKKHLGDFADQAALYVGAGASDIEVRDLNVVNSIPVMVTALEQKVKVVPQEDRTLGRVQRYILPHRHNLTLCDESTKPDSTQRLVEIFALKSDSAKVAALEALTDLTPGESAYLARSSKCNERGHAVALNGDRIRLEGVRIRGNQDCLWIGRGRMYFKDCDIIGGTDYIYGDATAVFHGCRLGAEGMTDKSYGATITAANHDPANPYGYLFYDCEVYNHADNITSGSVYGRPWRQGAQITFRGTVIDDTGDTGSSPAFIGGKGWTNMSNNSAALARFYEHGTRLRSTGTHADLTTRLASENGSGSALDEWQILEYNPRNYFNSSFWLTDKGLSPWDPMDYAAGMLGRVDAALSSVALPVPGRGGRIALPAAPEGVAFKWVASHPGVRISPDGRSLRLAASVPADATVTLYARDEATGAGDCRTINLR